MPFDTHSLLGYSTISTVISQDVNTVVVTVQTGHGTLFAANQQVTIWPANTQPLFSNAMVGRITAISGDQLTISVTSSNREGSNTRTVAVNDQIANSITPKALTDIESALDTHTHDARYYTEGEVDTLISAVPDLVANETPGGTLDGSNAVFTTAYAYIANSTRLFLNGQRMQLLGDYIESNTQEITFIEAPHPGDILTIDNLKT